MPPLAARTEQTVFDGPMVRDKKRPLSLACAQDKFTDSQPQKTCGLFINNPSRAGIAPTQWAEAGCLLLLRFNVFFVFFEIKEGCSQVGKDPGSDLELPPYRTYYRPSTENEEPTLSSRLSLAQSTAIHWQALHFGVLVSVGKTRLGPATGSPNICTLLHHLNRPILEVVIALFAMI